MKLTAAIIVTLCLYVAGCDDGKPVILESTRIPSPDGKLVAVVESVDNGLGFGQGIAYDEIHVGPTNLAVAVHGEEDPTAVFYASQESSSDKKLDVKWVDDHHLLVLYDPNRVPHKLLGLVAGIQIEYRPRSGS